MKFNKITLSVLFIIVAQISAETNSGKIVTGDDKPLKTSKLSIKEIVQRSMEFNPAVRNSKYELVKYDSQFLKSQSKYSWRIVGGADINQGKLPLNQAQLFSGTKTQTNKYALGTEKVFSTGTYFKVEASSQRFDSNAFEGNNAPGAFRAFGIPALYTSAVTATLSHDIIKNGFGGFSDMRTQEILKKQSEINKEELSLSLTNSVVQSLVDYWSYAISDSSLKTFEKLLANTKSIRDLTKQKTAIGLSEGFEVNQWNALYTQTENQLEKTKLERDESKRKILRTLNLTSDSEIGETTDLVETLPAELDFEKDKEYAFKNRGDWKNMKARKDISALAMKNAKTNALPSLTVAGSYAYTGQTITSPQDSFTDSALGASSFKYHNLNGSAKLNYPLFDPGVKVDLRDAEILKRQVALMEEDLKKEIEDDIQSRIDSVIVGHKILQNAIKTKKDSETYYNGILNSFRSGRFTAIAVKNALDSFVQNDLAEVQARINYNINLLRYEVAKNSLLKKYDINVDALVESF